MKSFKIHVLVIIAALVALVAGVSFAARSSRSQAPRPKSTSPVKPAVHITKRSESSAFAEATLKNVGLRNELNWTFGAKQQRGWYLYDLLISKTLKTEDDFTTGDFASALAAWQKRKGINADGVLDENSLMAMVAQWQSNRLKNRAYAEPNQLVTVPPSDFYDPSRLDELRQVERKTYEAYKEMVAAALADPTLKLAPGSKYFKIVSAFRSREYQDQLRRKSPNAGSAGLAVNNSPHFTGRALDLYVGGSPVDSRDSNRAIQVNTPAYRWLVLNAERFGFRPYFYEPWHWEYVK
jgi:zinc D-Ala-D-Ala carboxypeptidase